MNERIEKLKDQCWVERCWNNDMWIEKHIDLEKFAELIVAKCVAQCEFVAGQAEITNTGEMARKTKATADYCAFFIKEYFGVKE
jgi:hypothetical protein